MSETYYRKHLYIPVKSSAEIYIHVFISLPIRAADTSDESYK